MIISFKTNLFSLSKMKSIRLLIKENFVVSLILVLIIAIYSVIFFSIVEKFNRQLLNTFLSQNRLAIESANLYSLLPRIDNLEINDSVEYVIITKGNTLVYTSAKKAIEEIELKNPQIQNNDGSLKIFFQLQWSSATQVTFVAILLLLILIVFFTNKIYKLKVSKRVEILQLKIKSQEDINELSAKIAHDIRSPISTLNLIASHLPNQELRSLQNQVVNQINLIADELLTKMKFNSVSHHGIRQNNISKRSEVELADFLKAVRNEFEFKQSSIGRVFKFEFLEISEEFSIESKVSDLVYRAINNFIANSIDATKDGDIIKIKLALRYPGRSKILVEDNGCGIEPEIIANLGKIKISNKSGSRIGNGIGLYNLINDATSLYSKINIESKLNEWTRAEIEFPLIAGTIPKLKVNT